MCARTPPSLRPMLASTRPPTHRPSASPWQETSPGALAPAPPSTDAPLTRPCAPPADSLVLVIKHAVVAPGHLHQSPDPPPHRTPTPGGARPRLGQTATSSSVLRSTCLLPASCPRPHRRPLPASAPALSRFSSVASGSRHPGYLSTARSRQLQSPQRHLDIALLANGIT